MKLNIDLNELSLEELDTVLKLAKKQQGQKYLSIMADDVLKENNMSFEELNYIGKKTAGRPKGVKNKKKKINKHWSTYELNRLKSMNTAGYSDKRIAKELNRTVPSVSSMIWKIKVNYDRHNLKTLNPMKGTKSRRFKRWTDEDTEMLKTMFKKGHSNKSIAKALNRSEKSIDDKLYYIGLK